MLDSIVGEFGDRVAPVQWHGNSSYPLLYRREAWDKWHLYPPPMNNAYYYPWLWTDGRSSWYDFYRWRDTVFAHLSLPADVRLTHVGTHYDPGTRQGELRLECANDSPDEIDAAVQFVVTEDSIYYQTPNGDEWHNHVCRDYVPDHHGTSLVLAPGAADTVVIPFALDTTWNELRCNLVAWLQQMTVQPDSSMPCYQGSFARVMEFVGVVEERPVGPRPASGPTIVRGVLFLPASAGPAVLLDAAGRKARVLETGPNDVGSLSPGVYFVRGDRAGTWKVTLGR